MVAPEIEKMSEKLPIFKIDIDDNGELAEK